MMRFTHQRCDHKLIWYTGLDEVAVQTSPAQVKLGTSFAQDVPDERSPNILGPFVSATRTLLGSDNYDSNIEDYL